ncbi:MAG TPA: DUF4148 domain-containing protein [Rhizobacter sp.]|nr:DUF4148 domain-containing protein [Rhizobacter sp.]
MNTKQLIAGAALALVGAAASAETPDVQFGFITAAPASTVTRQQVQSELVQARRQGFDSVAGLPIAAAPAATVARTQVKSELAQARADQLVDNSNGFGFIDNNYASARTREDVRNEAVAAARGKKASVQAGQ